MLGSSPLARGLQTHRDELNGKIRIIPARAGFTQPVIRKLIHFTDHPRSRGVYAATPRIAARIVGSSPLARGLPRHDGSHPVWTGIIPARAGFTRSASPRPRWRPDHPRSRGVYVPSGPTTMTRPGSSPLARGLPRRASRLAYPNPDHPRSRGVYPGRVTGITASRGSSPLARGLR